MSITNYIQRLKDKMDISYMQMAKDMGITYENIMNLKNGRIAQPTLKLLKILSNYENRNQLDICIDIFKEDVREDFSPDTLTYLCQKYIEGYSIDFDVTITNPFEIKPIILEGTLVKRRYSSGHTAVESFEKIKREHWHIFEERTKIPYSNDAYSELFLNEAYYVSNVMSWAIQRILKSEGNYLKKYVILFRDQEEYEFAMDTFVNPTGFQVEFIYII